MLSEQENKNPLGHREVPQVLSRRRKTSFCCVGIKIGRARPGVCRNLCTLQRKKSRQCRRIKFKFLCWGSHLLLRLLPARNKGRSYIRGRRRRKENLLVEFGPLSLFLWFYQTRWKNGNEKEFRLHLGRSTLTGFWINPLRTILRCSFGCRSVLCFHIFCCAVPYAHEE